MFKSIMFLVIVAISISILSGCSTLPRQRAKDSVLRCVKDMMEYTKNATEAFDICKGIEQEF